MKKIKNIIPYLSFFFILLIFTPNAGGQVNWLHIHAGQKDKLLNSVKYSDRVEQENDELNIWQINKDSSIIRLLPGEKSNKIRFSGFEFNKKDIDHIKGLKIKVSAYFRGKGSIEDKEVIVTNSNGFVSQNYAKKNNKGKRWMPDAIDNVWYYYLDFDIDKIESSDLNNISVEYKIYNNSNDTCLVVIKSIGLEIDYYPVIDICQDDVVSFFLDDPALDYKWEIPACAEIISKSDNADFLVLRFSGDDYGIKKIIVGTKNNPSIVGERRLFYKDCTLGSIKGIVSAKDSCISNNDMFNADNTLYLLDKDKQIIDSLTLDTSAFIFDKIVPGLYFLAFHGDDNYFLDTIKSSNGFDLNDDIFISDSITVSGGETIDTLHLILNKKIDISGTVWEDLNFDGERDSLETNYFPYSVFRLYKNGKFEGSLKTDKNGDYNFNGVATGNYKVCIDTLIAPDSIFYYRKDIGCIEMLVCNDITRYYIPVFIPGAIEGKLWIDENENGLLDSLEYAVIGKKVFLFDTAMNILDTCVSDTSGYYQFKKLSYGEYRIGLHTGSDFYITKLHSGNDSIDCDFYQDSVFALSGVIDILSSTIESNINCGFIYKKCKTGDFVWYDENANGLQDSLENGIADVELILYTADSIALDTAFSDENGKYAFENVHYGDYFIHINFPGRYRSTVNIADSIKYDSDLIEGERNTAVFHLAPGEINNDIDFGLRDNFGKITSLAWFDENENGIYDIGEKGVSALEMQLMDLDSNIIAGAKTGEDGIAIFDEVLPGEYRLVVSKKPDSLILTKSHAIANDTIDSDFTAGGNKYYSDTITVVAGGNHVLTDIGLIKNYCSIEGIIWVDENGDLLPDSIESRIAGIEVQLYTGDSLVAVVLSQGIDGKYRFSRLNPGIYKVHINLPEIYKFSGSNSGDMHFDSTGVAEVELTKWGENKDDINCAIDYKKAVIGDFVWLDKDHNGLQDEDEPGIEGILVKLMKDDNTLVRVILTDENGKYTFDGVGKGKYYLQFVINNQYLFTTPQFDNEYGSKVFNSGLNLGKTRVFEITGPGENLDLDAGLVLNYASLGDLVWLDKNRNGIRDNGEEGLQGIGIHLFDEQGDTISSQYTQQGGGYSFDSLTQGMYYMSLDVPDSLLPPGYNGGQFDITGTYGKNTTDLFYISWGAKVKDADYGLIQKNGFAGDFVWLDENENGIQDAGETGLNNIRLEVYDEAGQLINFTYSHYFEGRDGYYKFELQPGKYYIKILYPEIYEPSISGVGDESTDCDITSANGANTTDYFYIKPGRSNRDIDFGLKYKRAAASGLVWLDANEDGIYQEYEKGVNGVRVNIYNRDNILVDSTITTGVNGVDGIYDFDNLKRGYYYIEFLPGEEYKFTKGNTGDDDNVDSDVEETLGFTTGEFFLNHGEVKSNIFAGLILKKDNYLGDYVWLDKDKDGVQDKNEQGINFVRVQLYNKDTVLQKMTLTFNNPLTGKPGYYKFKDIPEGRYFIRFVADWGYSFTKPGIGADSLDSDVIDQHGYTGMFYVGEDTKRDDIDAGMTFDSLGSIGDFVWEDINFNGIQDAGEPGINNILLILFKKDGGALKTCYTRDDGNGRKGYYKFDYLPVGEYFIKVVLPADYHPTRLALVSDSLRDSDFSDIFGEGFSGIIKVGVQERRKDIDFGLVRKATIGDLVWLDVDGDGIQDGEEPGVENIGLRLYSLDGSSSPVIYTDENGSYRFSNIDPGTYYLKVEGYGQYGFSPPKKGNDKTKDSDITSVNGYGTTHYFFVISGQYKDDLDVGLIQNSIKLNASPNPVLDHLELSFICDDKSDVEILITDINGNIAIKKDLVADPGENRVSVDLADLKLGYYNVILLIDNTIADKKTIFKADK